MDVSSRKNVIVFAIGATDSLQPKVHGLDARGKNVTMETISMGGLELRFLQSKEQTGGSVDIFEMTVQSNARMPVSHYHEDWDETIYGLTGSTTWQIDGQEITLEPHQTVFIKRGIVHGFRNHTQQPATCLCILTPGSLGPAYFREMAALLVDGPPDPQRMKETMMRYRLVPVPTI
jgi:quercetin dioxygenase-like cupin family protein